MVKVAQVEDVQEPQRGLGPFTLEDAAATLSPDETHLRTMFAGLMPQIQMLRAQGHSMRRIRQLLRKLGQRFELSMLKLLYAEFLTEQCVASQRETQRLVERLTAPQKSGELAAHGAEPAGGAADDVADRVCLIHPGTSQTVSLDAQLLRLTPDSANGKLFWSDVVLEHPAIPGLMLTREQRLYSGRLRFSIGTEIREEDMHQKTNRLSWTPPFKPTKVVSRTAGSHVFFDRSIFG